MPHAPGTVVSTANRRPAGMGPVSDRAKTKAQLFAELHALRAQLAACHAPAPRPHRAEPPMDDHRRDLEHRRTTVEDLHRLLTRAHGSIDPVLDHLTTAAQQLLGADA